MLIPARYRDAIASGELTVAFRRWKRCQVVAGHRYRTAAGRIEVDAVETVDPSTITDVDARRAGFAARTDLLAALRGDPALPVYRIAFHGFEGPDERAELAATARLTRADVADIDRRLARLDRASSHGAWTLDVLDVIARHPGVRAPDLASGFGRETQPFKTDVRKLKNLGLTISRRVGYELSPRGRAYLRARRDGCGA